MNTDPQRHDSTPIFDNRVVVSTSGTDSKSLASSPPSYDPVRAYRQNARMITQDDLLLWRADCQWLLARAGAEHWDAESRLMAQWRLEATQAELDSRDRRHLHRSTPESTISPEVLADLRSRVDLVRLIEDDDVALRRHGRYWCGICPFHNDRTPNFVVWPDKGRIRCFGCGIWGDSVTWLIARHRVEFRPAVFELCARVGLPLPLVNQSRQSRSLRVREVSHARQ